MMDRIIFECFLLIFFSYFLGGGCLSFVIHTKSNYRYILYSENQNEKMKCYLCMPFHHYYIYERCHSLRYCSWWNIVKKSLILKFLISRHFQNTFEIYQFNKRYLYILESRSVDTFVRVSNHSLNRFNIMI